MRKSLWGAALLPSPEGWHITGSSRAIWEAQQRDKPKHQVVWSRVSERAMLCSKALPAIPMDWRLTPASLCTYRQCYCCSVDFSLHSLPTDACKTSRASERARSPCKHFSPTGEPQSKLCVYSYAKYARGMREEKKTKTHPRGSRGDLRRQIWGTHTVLSFQSSKRSCGPIPCLARPSQPELYKSFPG